LDKHRTSKRKSSNSKVGHGAATTTTTKSLTTANAADVDTILSEQTMDTTPNHIYLDGVTSFWGSTSNIDITSEQGLDNKNTNEATTKSASSTSITAPTSTNNLDPTTTSQQQPLSSATRTNATTGTNNNNKTAAAAAATSSNKRKRNEDDNNITNQHQMKRSKNNNNTMDNHKINGIHATTGGSIIHDNNVNNNNMDRPSFIPKFLPPYPPSHTYLPKIRKNSNTLKAGGMVASTNYGTTTTDAAASVATSSSNNIGDNIISNNNISKPSSDQQLDEFGNVRSALVTLGKSVGTSYWGTQYQQHQQHAAMNYKTSRIPLSVTTSKITQFGATSTMNSSVDNATGVQQPKMQDRRGNVPVRPMAKASSNRTSRILEGSMDA